MCVCLWCVCVCVAHTGAGHGTTPAAAQQSAVTHTRTRTHTHGAESAAAAAGSQSVLHTHTARCPKSLLSLSGRERLVPGPVCVSLSLSFSVCSIAAVPFCGKSCTLLSHVGEEYPLTSF